MGILRGLISPHPPIVVPEVGGDEVRKIADTAEGLQALAGIVKDLAPEVIIVITPHGTVFQDAVAVNSVSRLKGNLGQFGAGQVRFDYPNDTELVDEIIRVSVKKGISAVAMDEGLAKSYGVSVKLDHGVMVPLYYLIKSGVGFSLISISMGFLPFEELYRFGTCLKEAVEKLGRRAVILGSGDLSHRLTPDAPAGFTPRGIEYDLLLKELIEKGDVEGILRIDNDLLEDAGECGLRSFIIMFGAFDGRKVETNVFSYEGPFGVGYLVADIIPGEEDEKRRIIDKLFEKREEKIKETRIKESPPVALARKTLESYIKSGTMISPPGELDEILKKRAGVFVSLKKHGQLRGCIGTIEPSQPNVAEEIIHNAVSAGVRDPRFNPVTSKELDDLIYSVDILYAPEPISGIEELDPKKYGVIVRSGYKSGLLLPNLEGIDVAEEQVEIARRKAGIERNEPVKMERFEVVRYY